MSDTKRTPSQVLRDISPQLSDELHEYVGKAVNSYNPDRDKLARELAEMIGVAQEFRERMQSIPADWGAIEAKARQLLKLFGDGESRSPDGVHEEAKER